MRTTRQRVLGVLALSGALLAAATAAVPIRVEGLGWLKNRGMGIALEQLTNAREAEVLAANAIEDAAVILNSALEQEGFQEPAITVVVTRTDGRKVEFVFDPTFTAPVPRPLDASAVAFRVRAGVRWRVAHVRINGLAALPPDEAVAFFRTDAVLLNVAQANAFSRGQLNRSAGALLDELRRRGHAEATVRAEVAGVDRKTGEVSIAVEVAEGPRWEIYDVEINHADVPGVVLPDATQWSGVDWTPTLEQEIREAVRLALYRGGYPDVGINVATETDEPENGVRLTDVIVTVVPGDRIAAGRPQFVGNEVTRESVLRRRVEVEPGEPLNPVALERARHRISRLGVFESVQLQYEPEDAPVRDPVFVLEEGPRYETNLLFGYGSYEQFRGGVEFRQRNILGLAHQSRLLLTQSMKSSRGEYTYTVPELFGETIDGSAKLFGLQREELAFIRQEFGATFSARRRIDPLHGDAVVGYTFQALRNRRNELSTVQTDERQLNVASLNVALTTDRRDNPLRPRRGYHAIAQAEFASPWLGGVAEYQRFEIAGAYHTPWGRGRWIHVGASYGVITTMGAQDDTDLPVNKRFYPGGDNSIRGYQAGEAAPRGPDGRFMGAKTYALLNIELEQALTRAWSAVAFADALNSSASLRAYRAGERLYSVGLGLRYQTIVGPIRLEYGRNVNPRPGDPSGTWHLSLGFPF